MSLHNFSAPLVGDYFRPPAKALIQLLPIDHPLILQREPDNAFDPNAVKVILETSTLQAIPAPSPIDQLLDEKCGPFGFSADEIFASSEWHLGYIAKEFAVHLTKLLIDENEEPIPYTATLSFFTNEKGQNKPQVMIEIEIHEE